MSFYNDMIGELKNMWARRHEPEVHHRFANLYWRTVVLFFSVALVGVIGYGIWTILSVLGSINTPPRDVKVSAPPLDRTQLTDLLGSFEKRKAEYEQLKIKVPALVTDPSR